MEILTPGVKHGQEADHRTQMLGVRCNREHCLGHRPEEDAVDGLGVLQCHRSDLLRQRKHYVEILLHR